MLSFVNGNRNTLWISALTLVLVFLGLRVLSTLFFGTFNYDEGWYLYAGKLVYEGKLPYRDFAYTQTPLLPYIYGLPQLISRGVFTGRLTSLTLTSINFLLGFMMSMKLSGKRAVLFYALLAASYTSAIYFLTVVKTYALVSLGFTGTIFVLTQTRYQSFTKYYLAVLIAIMPTLVRLSAAPFSVVIILYCLYRVGNKPRELFLIVLTVVVIAASTYAIFIAPDPESAAWNLLSHHLGQWGDLTFPEKVKEIVSVRLWDYLDLLKLNLLLLGFSMLAIIWSGRTREFLNHHKAIIVFLVGLFLFDASHFFTGNVYEEYFAPSSASMLFALAITMSFAWELDRAVWVKNGMLAATLLAFAIVSSSSLVVSNTGSYKLWLPLDIRGTPFKRMHTISQYIQDHTSEDDQVLALWETWYPLEARRDLLPGLSMSGFSYVDLDTEQAQSLHLVNLEILTGYISNRTPALIVLNDFMDKLIFEDEVIFSQILCNYDEAERLRYDNSLIYIHIYIRKDNPDCVNE